MRRLVMFLAVFLIGFPAIAGAVEVGDPLPDPLNAIDQDGTAQSFESLKGKHGAVIVFVRSADWCPYCQAQLLDLAEKSEGITSKGYNIFTVSYDSQERLKNFVSKYQFPYPMLSDEGSKIIKAFGILNEQMAEGSPYHGIPHPAVYIVSADGFVQSVLAEEHYKDRPQVSAIVEAIEASNF